MNRDSAAVETFGPVVSVSPPASNLTATQAELCGHEAPVVTGFEWMLPLVRALPHPAICRAKAVGFGGFASCLVDYPFYFVHALSFGFGFACCRPELARIVRNTPALGL